MTLEKTLAQQGQFLFRWRSYLPIPLVLAAIIMGSRTGYLRGSPVLDQYWELFALGVGLLGLAIRCLVAGYAAPHSSGRNTSQQEAGALNTKGMYSLVRHPLYLANYLMWAGVLLFARSLSLFIITTLLYWIYYERIIFAEEHFLRGKFGAAFESWAAQTRTFLPRLRGWRAPDTPFDWRRVVLHENSSLTAFIVVLLLVEIATDARQRGNWVPDTLWLAIAAVCALLFAIVRVWKWSLRRRRRALRRAA